MSVGGPPAPFGGEFLLYQTEYYRSISLAGIWPFLLDDDGRLN